MKRSVGCVHSGSAMRRVCGAVTLVAGWWLDGADFLFELGCWWLVLTLLTGFAAAMLMYLTGFESPVVMDMAVYAIGVVVLPLGFGAGYLRR